MAFTSKLEGIIQQAWNERDLGKSKKLVVNYISNSKIKSKDTIISTLDSINSKVKLDFYLANSLLKFEKLSLS
jgi:hypothetical protein